MRGSDSSSGGRTAITLKAPPAGAVEIGFEPIGSAFTVRDGDFVVLELDAASVARLEFVSWPNGIAVWVPYPGDYVVRDSAGQELDRL